MARRTGSVASQIIDTRESTVLDTLDELLNVGVLADGDVTLGLAGVDLIYLRLSALLCAADRVLPRVPPPVPRSTPRRRHRKPRA
jgi:Gas vesicle protein